MQKITEKAQVEYDFWNNIPEKHRPKMILLSEDRIQYERVVGQHPTLQEDWDKIWKAGVDHFWLGLDLTHTEDFLVWSRENQVTQVLDWTSNAHPTRLLHGCPRAEHIVMEIETGFPVFISPHEPEIFCREWDEAYLLMSIVTMWESWTRNWSVDHIKNGMRPEIIPPFEVTDVHKMFLLAHWEKEVRNGKVTFGMAKAILPELKKDWSPVDLRAKIMEMIAK